MRRFVVFGIAVVAAVLCAALPVWGKGKGGVLRLSTTTSTVDSGLLDYLLPFFEKKTGIKVDVVGVGSGKALKLGEAGDVDVVLVHARAAEDRFVRDGFGVKRRGVMHNDFVIVGPAEDPAKVRYMRFANVAFRKIAGSRSRFVSRGDGSGTDLKEKELWVSAGVKPSGGWFIESGQGMGATLAMADEMRAYTLVDRATYLAYEAKIDLPIMVEGDRALLNPYGVIAVNPKRWRHVRFDLAMKFIDWITSPEGQKLIGGFKVSGVRLFVPDAK